MGRKKGGKKPVKQQMKNAESTTEVSINTFLITLLLPFLFLK